MFDWCLDKAKRDLGVAEGLVYAAKLRVSHYRNTVLLGARPETEWHRKNLNELWENVHRREDVVAACRADVRRWEAICTKSDNMPSVDWAEFNEDVPEYPII
jgi:hypothetical protein